MQIALPKWPLTINLTASKKEVATKPLLSLTEQELIQLLNEKLHNPQDTMLMFWQANAVYSAILQQQNLNYSQQSPYIAEHILEIRAFNASEELYIKRTYAGFTWRYRLDTPGNTQEYLDSAARIWGELAINKQTPQAFTCYKDTGRRISLCIPCPLKSKYAELLTRSYIEYDSNTNQAYYSDYRYLGFVEGRNKNE